jgi:DNA-binding NtrC family response regulator
MAQAIDRLRIPGRRPAEMLAVPAFSGPNTPLWLRERAKTVVLVIDDCIQSTIELSDEGALRRRMLEPLNVELVFCPECRSGGLLARAGKWIPAAEQLLEKHSARAAAIFLDLLFEGDRDPASGAGMEFLRQLRRRKSRLPLLILTAEQEERRLQAVLAREGLHHDFLRKGSDDLIGAMSRFLIEQGWIAQPAVGAFSSAMREQVCRLRQYAIFRQRLESGLPAPILITGDSGSGKSHLANRTAEWLLAVEPALRRGKIIETFVASEVERGQSATIELFGRGPMPPAEKATFAGLAVLGKAQRADQGVLIVEELGNSSHDLQRLLLSFVETGKTQPLFPNNSMDARSLGPLDVLCIFTAQPRHLVSGDIIEDLKRRAMHGRTIMQIPPLQERVEDIVPIFYATLKSLRRAVDPDWVEPEALEEVILPEAQSWLEDAAITRRLSASGIADLVGQPRITIIGVPFLEDQLQRRLPEILVKYDENDALDRDIPPAKKASTSIAEPPVDGLSLVALLASGATLNFPRDAAKLRGQLQEAEAAAANLLLSYLEACLEVKMGGDPVINITGTYKFQSDDQSLQTNQVKGQYGKLFELERTPRMVLRKLQESDLLASLALALGAGNRRRGVVDLIESLMSDPNARNRLRRLLSMLRPEDGRIKAEEFLDACDQKFNSS